MYNNTIDVHLSRVFRFLMYKVINAKTRCLYDQSSAHEFFYEIKADNDESWYIQELTFFSLQNVRRTWFQITHGRRRTLRVVVGRCFFFIDYFFFYIAPKMTCARVGLMRESKHRITRSSWRRAINGRCTPYSCAPQLCTHHKWMLMCVQCS